MTVPAPGIAGRYGTRVRTPELPMAFTFGEFARGAGVAWLTFQILFPLANFVITLVGSIVSPTGGDVGSAFYMGIVGLLFTFGYALPWSIGALLLIGGPLAWALGSSLRRVRGMGWHVAAFTVLGIGVGAVTALTATAAMGMYVWPNLYLTALSAASTGVAVTCGWWRTARRALADDVRLREYAERVAADAPPDRLN